MKFTLSNNQQVQFDVRHQYSGTNQKSLQELYLIKQSIEKTITSLRVLGELSEGARAIGLIDYWTEKLRHVKGSISCIKNCPIKTNVTFKLLADGEIVYSAEAFSSISRPDACDGRHDKGVGRYAAINRLLKKLVNDKVLDKYARSEVADKLLFRVTKTA